MAAAHVEHRRAAMLVGLFVPCMACPVGKIAMAQVVAAPLRQLREHGRELEDHHEDEQTAEHLQYLRMARSTVPVKSFKSRGEYDNHPVSLVAPARNWTTSMNRRLGIASGALAAIAAISSFAYHERREEHDRHVLLDHISRIEQAVRRHDEAVFGYVETHSGTPPDPQVEVAHQQMLRDFDRLSHLEGFGMRDIEIAIDGDKATASYRVEGQLPRSQAVPGLLPAQQWPAPPSAGRLEFSRSGSGWVLAGHRLIE